MELATMTPEEDEHPDEDRWDPKHPQRDPEEDD